jgi:hypothetical protein
MNRIRIIRRLACLLAALASAVLASAAAVPAAFAARIPPLGTPPGPAPLPPGHVAGAVLGPNRAGYPAVTHVQTAVLGPNRAGYPPVSHIHTVVAVGMPGWKIAFIAAGAAILAAALAVLLERARTSRRHLAAPSA